MICSAELNSHTLFFLMWQKPKDEDFIWSRCAEAQISLRKCRRFTTLIELSSCVCMCVYVVINSALPTEQTVNCSHCDFFFQFHSDITFLPFTDISLWYFVSGMDSWAWNTQRSCSPSPGIAQRQKLVWYHFSFFSIKKKQCHFLCYSPIWHIFIEQENKLPKDLLTHLAEVISKSRGRWCHGQILHCFRGVLICIYKQQPCLAVRNIFVLHDWMGVWKSVFSSVGFQVETGFTTASQSTGTLRMFLLRGGT